VEHHLTEHPEHAGRIRAVWKRMDESGLLPRLTAREARPATPAQAGAIHAADYLKLLARTGEQERILHLDADTYITPSSCDVAYLSAGGVVDAVDGVLSGEAANALVVTRPPGHHAIGPRGMGFCLLNNVAIGAQHAIDAYGLKRVLIVDYDVHHGNGTDDIFAARSDVFFVSTHQYPLYPMSGLATDIGTGEGRGFTLNVPLPRYCGDVSYARVFDELVLPAARQYRPELVIVSAGYDGHWADPLANMQLTLNGFAGLGQKLKSLADETCGGRIIFAMEGGYYVEALAYGLVNVARILLGDTPVDPLGEPDLPKPEPDITGLIQELKAIHGL
jgi:acetoin utilization deacetylase AcuC-like enzyme